MSTPNLVHVTDINQLGYWIKKDQILFMKELNIHLETVDGVEIRFYKVHVEFQDCSELTLDLPEVDFNKLVE